ncbi:MAG: OmpA family protein, partial [Prevotella sp.]|nr:OmpA family protein [Prevotella sp.]
YPKAKVALCGYADAQTGNDRINDRLGLQRVTVVKNMLINEYNIPESRITADSKGAREQPFAINEQNRVTIAIAE